MRYICVFCGSSIGRRPIYQQTAWQFGEALAAAGIGLVYGGGKVGLMGTVADAVLAAGGEAVGVIPDFLVKKEVAHLGLTTLHVVESMHERKALMAELANAFVALPGGYGTFEEFCEVLTWSQLGLHGKPQGILNVEGYYDPLLQLFDHAVEEGFLAQTLRSLVLEATEPLALLDLLLLYQPRALDKWDTAARQSQ